MQIIDHSSDAFQMTVENPAMRAYLQRYPFLIGPDKAMNELARKAIFDGLASRNRVATPTTVRRLQPEETRLTAEQMDRLLRIMDESQVPQAVRAEMIDDYAWEANLVPLETKSALVLGCADGTELMFLRAVLPDAKITALDYQDEIPPARKRAVDVRFLQGDMNALIAGFGQEFDLVSSNHTLEHLYTPNEVLTTLAGLLQPHGALISTLPMDAMEGSPFLSKVRQAVKRKTIHPLDVVYLDAGHPWKTNPVDLDVTLQEAGFERPQLYQRQQHLSRYANFGETRFKAQFAFGRVLHALIFGLPRTVAKAVLAGTPQRLFGRGLLAAERRVWFGSNMLKNLYTQEACVLARKNSSAS